MKKFILTILGVLVISAFAVNPAEAGSLNSNSGYTVNTSYEDTYTYEYVWIDGVRWVYVYTEDGNLVEVYPDPN